MVSRSTVEEAVLLMAGSGGCSSSLSLIVMTSRGRDWAEEPDPEGLSQLIGLELLLE